jgi:hypothetical protein
MANEWWCMFLSGSQVAAKLFSVQLFLAIFVWA